MKLLIFCAIAIFGIAGTAVAQDQKSESMRVQVKHEKKFRDSKITVEFLELVEDSRCPTDTDCIWAGNAKIMVKLSKNGRTKTAEFNTQGDKKAVLFYGYSIMLTELKPEPASNVRINRNEYTAAFEAVKLSR